MIIIDYLEKQQKKFPNKIAIVDGEKELTFSQLRDSARRVASGLSDLGIFHRPVAVYLEQSAESVVSFLGAAYSGNYSFLKTGMPVTGSILPMETFLLRGRPFWSRKDTDSYR